MPKVALYCCCCRYVAISLADKKRRSKWDVASGTSGSGSHTSSPSHTKDPSGVGAQALMNANLINKEMLKLLPARK